MTPIRIPTRFFNDHSERDLPTPQIIGHKSGGYLICSDDPALPELIDDAKYYADVNGPDAAPAGLKGAAKALLKALA
jgi:hypothetical protein